MNTYDYLTHLMAEKLGSDPGRIGELFNDDSTFQALVALDAANPCWLMFSRRGCDGWYLVRTDVGYESYYQERGGTLWNTTFRDLKEAAQYHFSACGIAVVPQPPPVETSGSISWVLRIMAAGAPPPPIRAIRIIDRVFHILDIFFVTVFGFLLLCMVAMYLYFS